MAIPIARVRTILSYPQGGPGLNTFYFVNGNQMPATADITDVLARVRAFWFALVNFFPASSSFQVQSQVDTLDALDGGLLASAVGPPQANVVGTAASLYNPYAAMYLLRLNTIVIDDGRRILGRSFIGPIGRATADSGNPSTTASTTMTTAANAMITGGATFQPTVWRRPRPAGSGKNGDLPARLGYVAPVSTFSVAPFFGSLRSRRD